MLEALLNRILIHYGRARFVNQLKHFGISAFLAIPRIRHRCVAAGHRLIQEILHLAHDRFAASYPFYFPIHIVGHCVNLIIPLKVIRTKLPCTLPGYIYSICPAYFLRKPVWRLPNMVRFCPGRIHDPVLSAFSSLMFQHPFSYRRPAYIAQANHQYSHAAKLLSFTGFEIPVTTTFHKVYALPHTHLVPTAHAYLCYSPWSSV